MTSCISLELGIAHRAMLTLQSHRACAGCAGNLCLAPWHALQLQVASCVEILALENTFLVVGPDGFDVVDPRTAGQSHGGALAGSLSYVSRLGGCIVCCPLRGIS